MIWGLGLIALMCVSVIAAARWRLAAAANLSGAAQAASLADAAGAIATARFNAGRGTPGSRDLLSYDGAPWFCTMPQGALAAIAIEDEGGKVDLNAAPPQLLAALLTGFGTAPAEAVAMARAIVEFRSATGDGSVLVASAGEATGGTIAPKHALFQTIYELDQVAGIPPALARDLFPFLTISSGRAGIDPTVAPPALFAALSGASLDEVRARIAAPYPNTLDRSGQSFPLPFLQKSPGGTLLVHAEVAMPSGAMAVRETLNDVRRPFGAPVAIKEVRHGAARYRTRLLTLLQSQGNALPEC